VTQSRISPSTSTPTGSRIKSRSPPIGADGVEPVTAYLHLLAATSPVSLAFKLAKAMSRRVPARADLIWPSASSW
jgi:hypothetical protein